MHTEARQWFTRFATDEPLAVVEFGARNLNGTIRDLFPNADPYLALDIADGPGVDVVADAATWQPDRCYDRVLSAECFEHTPHWPAICVTAYRALRPGGMFIATMAGPGRPPHSSVDGGWTLHPGEHYANVDPDDLLHVLIRCGFEQVTVDYLASPGDVRAHAVRPVRVLSTT